MSEEEEYEWRGSDERAVMMPRAHIQCVLAFHPSVFLQIKVSRQTLTLRLKNTGTLIHFSDTNVLTRRWCQHIAINQQKGLSRMNLMQFSVGH